jgi:hypothetical protein
MALKHLTLTSLPPSTRNPVDSRRVKIIARLEEQKKLLADPSYVRTAKRWAKINGEKSLVEKQQRIYPWWRMGPNGPVFFIRVGGRTVEIEKGKAGIAAGSLEQLPTIIDTVIAAVASGELDAVLAQAGRGGSPPKRKS